MDPIAEKVQTKIKELATEKGYTYILNAMDGAGTSVILNGPDGDNITSDLMAKLESNYQKDNKLRTKKYER